MKQRLFPLKKRTYFALCFLSLLIPIVFVFVETLLFHGDPYSNHTIKLMWVTLLGFALLTYPLGMIPTLISLFITAYLVWLPPWGSVIFLCPLYFFAGYIQWYVLTPRYSTPVGK